MQIERYIIEIEPEHFISKMFDESGPTHRIATDASGAEWYSKDRISLLKQLYLITWMKHYPNLKIYRITFDVNMEREVI